MKAIQFQAVGGPEVLQLVDVDEPTPAAGEIAVSIEAAGVNFIDTYHRSGLYDVSLPCIPGSEAAGTIIGLGEGVTDRSIGERVAWVHALGNYAEVATIPASTAVAIPDDLSSQTAAALMLQGMTAHYLAVDTYPLKPGDRCLIHAGAGGVGLILIQLAKRRGAEVFTTVGSAEKAELASAAGADHVILYRDVDFEAAIQAIAGERPLDVVYDGVGADTFEAGLRLLRRRGLMATFGNASGAVPPISPLALSAGSLYLTRPTLWDYISAPGELEERATELFSAVLDGSVDIRIGATYALAEAESAHIALTGRTTTGKVILIP